MKHMIDHQGLNGFGIYIHVPFCISKCDYCDFFSIPVGNVGRTKHLNNDMSNGYLSALLTEIAQRSELFRTNGVVRSIFFGGGTPSLLPVEKISQILYHIKEEFDLSPECEITLEGNPEQMDLEYLTELHQAGVNRVNIGLQSFNFIHLAHYHRYYNPERYAMILEDLDASPIPHKGVDLIYGFPGQSEMDFQKDLARVFLSSVDHLSLYSLTMEAGSKYGRRCESGEDMIPDEDQQSDIFQMLPAQLSSHNFKHYEVSNFAKDGGECLHNMGYWEYRPYLALGPSAHGFDGVYRYENPSQLDLWMDNPSGAGIKLHDPGMEIPIGLFRITGGISTHLLGELFNRYYNNHERVLGAVLKLMEGWVNDKLGYWDDHGLYRWEMPGILFLDDRILQMCNILEEQRDELRNPF